MILPPPPRKLQRAFVLRRLHLGIAIMIAGVAIFLTGPILQMRGALIPMLVGLAGLFGGWGLVYRWWLARDGLEATLQPPPKRKNLLFVDRWNTSAIALCFGDQRFWLREDFWPLQFTDEELAAAREKLQQQRDLQKLVTDPFTC
jgi:hypothetical protein